MTKKRDAVNVGIDVGKAQLDVCLLERSLTFQVANESAAIRALVTRLARYRLARIVIEATGRLEQPFAREALARRLPVIVVSPLKVRRYAGAIGQLAKSDEIDARLIARFAAAVEPVAHTPCDPEAEKIKDLIVRRCQLTTMRTMEKNRKQVMPARHYKTVSTSSSKPWIGKFISSIESLTGPSITMPGGDTNEICLPVCLALVKRWPIPYSEICPN